MTNADCPANSARYHAAAGTAIVAAAFCLVVAGTMLATQWKSRGSGPLDSPELLALKDSLREHPTDDAVKTRIRALDLRLRSDFFARRQMSRSGGVILLCGVAVLLAALSAAAGLRERRPRLDTPPDARTRWTRTSLGGRVALAAAGSALGGLAVVTISASAPDLRGRLAQVVAEKPAPPPPVPKTATPYPAWDEIRTNWPYFRGPGGLGVSAFTNVPVAWNAAKGEGVLWKAPVPLAGKSSPLVWGQRVFLTGGDAKTRKVFCFHADTGERLWEKAAPPAAGGEGEPPNVMEDTGFAAPTPATDGRRVYAIFANGDLVAFDYQGEQAWAMNLGVPQNAYGHASSLAMWCNLLLVQFDQGGPDDGKSRLLAIDGPSGSIVWQTQRPVGASWCSPIVIRDSGREQIVTCANPWVIAYNPLDGTEVWRANCLGGEVAPTPVFGDGRVYAVNQGACLAAIRADGQGDVTESHVAWRASDGLPDICSPCTDGKRVWVLTTGGLLTCYKADTGAKLWEKDFSTSCFASPGIAGNLLYVLTEDGAAILAEAGDQYAEKGRAELGEKVYACPAFADGRLYVRGAEHLFCIGKAGAR